jgi:hypothetical protein
MATRLGIQPEYMTTETQQLSEQLENIQALYPETVLLGSLGRAAMMQEELPVRRSDGPYAKNIQEEVSNEVFGISRHTFDGVVVQTFNPYTQLQIQDMMARSRSKDIEPAARLRAFVASQPNPLPQEAYEPFRRFKAGVSERNQRRGLQYAEKVGGILLAYVPERIKTVARPSFRQISHRIIDLVS